jgi:hypothetical protein
MPYYKFRNKETDEITEILLKISELDSYKEINPNLESYIDAVPMLGDGMRMSVPGIGQPVAAFEKGVIERIKQSVPGNTLGKNHKTKLPREW